VLTRLVLGVGAMFCKARDSEKCTMTKKNDREMIVCCRRRDLFGRFMFDDFALGRYHINRVA